MECNHILNNVNVNQYRFFHFSENDIEYYPGGDKELLVKFRAFPKVGQISPYSPFPQESKGEIWGTKQAKLVIKGELSLYMTKGNVGTTCIVRKKLIQQGLRWRNYEQGRFPADRKFSAHVKKLGWDVAWNDKYLATNWGHNIIEYQKDVDYYIKNYSRKALGLAGFKRRLKNNGYELIEQKDGCYKIEQSTMKRNNRQNKKE
ncbi:MAG: hypothetical protein ACQEWV_15395 [Bacillota bacterium]